MSADIPGRETGEPTEEERARDRFFMCLGAQCALPNHIEGYVNRHIVRFAEPPYLLDSLLESPLADLVLPRGTVVGVAEECIFEPYYYPSFGERELRPHGLLLAPTVLGGGDNTMLVYWENPGLKKPYYLGVVVLDVQPGFGDMRRRTVSQQVGIAMDNGGRPTASAVVRVDGKVQAEYEQVRVAEPKDIDYIVDLFGQLVRQ